MNELAYVLRISSTQSLRKFLYREHYTMEYQQDVLINGDGEKVFPLLRQVKLSGTNFEIGKQLAEINITNHGDTLEKHRVPDPIYARARREYFQQHYPIFWERMRGVAAALNADPHEDQFDFSAMWHNVDLLPRPGCSNAFYPPGHTASGHAYLSRNYEFSTGPFAEAAGMKLDSKTRAQMKAMMGEPYIMEWHPADGGNLHPGPISMDGNTCSSLMA